MWIVKSLKSYILVFIGFETKRREIGKTTVVTRSKEPLKETPQETE